MIDLKQGLLTLSKRGIQRHQNPTCGQKYITSVTIRATIKSEQKKFRSNISLSRNIYTNTGHIHCGRSAFSVWAQPPEHPLDQHIEADQRNIYSFRHARTRTHTRTHTHTHSLFFFSYVVDICLLMFSFLN